jgi:hypothetical protein
MEHGPVDVVILASGAPKFDGSIMAELERLAQSGTIRVLDVMLLMMTPDGLRVSLDIEDLDAETKAALGFIDRGTRGLFDARDADMLWEGMVPGSAIVALAIENTWAIALVNSMAAAGVELALNWRIPAPIVDEAFAALAAAE